MRCDCGRSIGEQFGSGTASDWVGLMYMSTMLGKSEELWIVHTEQEGVIRTGKRIMVWPMVYRRVIWRV